MGLVPPEIDATPLFVIKLLRIGYGTDLFFCHNTPLKLGVEFACIIKPLNKRLEKQPPIVILKVGNRS